MKNSTCIEDMTPAGYRRGTARAMALRTAFCAAALILPQLAAAAAWDVDPVRVELSPEQQTGAVTIRNDSDQSTSIQIQAVAWSQVGGKDVYTPTRELLVSPPIVTIAPKTEQVVRVALRRPADAVNELSYRINLQELPAQPVAGFSGVQVALRIGLPVFVQPAKGQAAPKMAWSVTRMPDHQLKVGLLNQGSAHVQVSDFSLFIPGSDQSIAAQAGSSYVLAGQSQEWLLKTGTPGILPSGQLRLKAYTDAGDTETSLVLGKP
ncbi:MAG: molecular chaperone [Proteobacteria bacterium]|nr:molecular chaperone [Pseudomonadota bacterium]